MTFLSFLCFFSCSDQQIEKEALPQTISSFKASSQFDKLSENFPVLAATLSFGEYWNDDFNGTKIYSVPSKIEGRIQGVVYFDDSFNAIVEIRTFTDDKVHLSFQDFDGVEIVNWTGMRIGENYSFSYEDLSNAYLRQSLTGRATSCTGDCYKSAKDACDRDGDCKLMCDLTPGCNISIAVACFWHCW